MVHKGFDIFIAIHCSLYIFFLVASGLLHHCYVILPRNRRAEMFFMCLDLLFFFIIYLLFSLPVLPPQFLLPLWFQLALLFQLASSSAAVRPKEGTRKAEHEPPSLKDSWLRLGDWLFPRWRCIGWFFIKGEFSSQQHCGFLTAIVPWNY